MAFRKNVAKGPAAKKFGRDVFTTKSINMKAAPMRGGIRL